MKDIKVTACLIAALTAACASAAVNRVPEDYPNIQAAINACEDYDAVIIAPGTYSGTGNRNLRFNGKAITVTGTNVSGVSATIIDCMGGARGFLFGLGEGANSRITTLTIKNGYGFSGGAVYCYNNSSPTITNCTLIGNSAVFGGAIACENSKTKPQINNCSIKANSALVGGGALYCNGASPKVSNCIILENSASQGGAVYSHNAGSPAIKNCTIGENSASMSAGGIYCYNASNLLLENSILWQDGAPYATEILVGNGGSTATQVCLSYCDIEEPLKSVINESGGIIDWQEGNISTDPCFVSTSDYHLLEGSACIEAGDPAFVPEPAETDIDGEPRISGLAIDIGADEYRLAIVLDVNIMPKSLNLESGGEYITCMITCGETCGVSDIDAESIKLNGVLSPVRTNTDNRQQKLISKFSRSNVQEMLKSEGDSVILTVTGKLKDGTSFEGCDSIKLIEPVKEADRYRYYSQSTKRNGK